MLTMLPIGPKAHNIDESTHGNGDGRHTHLWQRHPTPSQRVPQKILKQVFVFQMTLAIAMQLWCQWNETIKTLIKGQVE